MAVVMPLEKVTELVRRQVEKLASLLAEAGGNLHHVKLHGALYNQANRDSSLAAAAIKGISNISKELKLYALPNGCLAAAGRAAGLTVCGEGFADRRYREDGSLMPRTEPGALITDVETAVSQTMQLLSNEEIKPSASTETARRQWRCYKPFIER
ncbi:MAG: LamB/YcsF family protein [Akkermansiaceae bacterium]|nr:LamB/YcsF family protein [Akkermansiaceae bacterium]